MQGYWDMKTKIFFKKIKIFWRGAKWHKVVGEMRKCVGEVTQVVGEVTQVVGEMKQFCWGSDTKIVGEMPQIQSAAYPIETTTNNFRFATKHICMYAQLSMNSHHLLNRQSWVTMKCGYDSFSDQRHIWVSKWGESGRRSIRKVKLA